MLRRLQQLAGPLFGSRFWRAKLAASQAAAFDREYGTDTVQRVAIAAMNTVPEHLAKHAVWYEASAIPKVQRALKRVQEHLGSALNDYSFVDIGSGKGLVAMLASRYPFRHIYGVEMSPELHTVAQSNLLKYSSRNSGCAPITLACGDALTFEFPAGNFVAYLYNPFDAQLTQRFFARLAKVGEARRKLLIVYVNPVHRQVCDNDSRFPCLYDDSALCIYRVAAESESSQVDARSAAVRNAGDPL